MLRSSSSRWIAATFILVLTLLLGACQAGASPSETAEESAPDETVAESAAATEEATPEPEPASITFALPVSVPDEGQVWAYVPNGAGYFEEENLEVTFVPSEGGGDALRQVATGNADVSVGSPENMLNAVNEGLDLQAVATVITTQIFDIAVLPDGDVHSYDDLQGGRVGPSSFTSGSFPFAKFALAENGIDPETEVEFVPVGSGGPALEALRNGEVDALSTWDTQLAGFSILGTELETLPPASNANFPADQILVRTDFLDEQPDVVARFTRAVMKGIVFANAHPEEAIEMFREQFPESAAARSAEESVAVLEQRLTNMQLRDDQEGWGWIPIDAYAELQAAALDLETVVAEQDLEAIMTNELADQIQDFDPDAVAGG
jgi:NitT/TauT family transport system substrate-binding protein